MLTLFEFAGGRQGEISITSFAPIQGRHLTLPNLEDYIIKVNLQAVMSLRKNQAYPMEIQESTVIVQNPVFEGLSDSCPCQGTCAGGNNFQNTNLCKNLI